MQIKTRGPVKTIKDKISVRNSKINKRDHFSDDRLFKKQPSSIVAEPPAGLGPA